MESPADFPGRPEALQVRNENLGCGARWLPAPICCWAQMWQDETVPTPPTASQKEDVTKNRLWIRDGAGWPWGWGGSEGPGMCPREAARAGVREVRPGIFQKQVSGWRGKCTVCLPTGLVCLDIFKEPPRNVSPPNPPPGAQDTYPLPSIYTKQGVQKGQESMGIPGLVPLRVPSTGWEKQGLVHRMRPHTQARLLLPRWRDGERLRASGNAPHVLGLPQGSMGPGLGALTVDLEYSRVLGLLSQDGLLNTLLVFPEKPDGGGGHSQTLQRDRSCAPGSVLRAGGHLGRPKHRHQVLA